MNVTPSPAPATRVAERAEGATAGPLVERLRALSATLSPAERRVADTILRDPVDVIHLSVSEVAASAGVSAATVVRMCVTLGLRGFQELKLTLAREALPPGSQLVDSHDAMDDTAGILAHVMGATSSAIQTAATALDPAVVESVVEAVRRARRVQFTAVGTSAPLAGDAAYRFMTIGIDSAFFPDAHNQHVAARMLTADDVLFVISHTGSTFETLATTRAARAAGATIVVLTSFTRSPLTEVADHALIAGSAETAYRVEAMASRIVHLSVLDALFILCARMSPDAVRFQELAADVLIEHRH